MTDTTEDRAVGDERSVLPMPVDVRSAALVTLAVIAALALLHWAKAVFIPLLLGAMLSYALMPVVDRLARWRVHRGASAALLLLALIGGLAFAGVSLQDDTAAMIESLPQTAHKLGRAIGALHARDGALGKVQEAAEEIEQAVKAAPKRGARPAPVEAPKLDVRGYLWTGTLGLLALIGQAVIVVFLAFFVLASGTTFRRKMISIAGPTFTRRKITLQLLDEIAQQIQRYLLVNVFASVLVGAATWLTFLWIGLEHAAVWGVLAAALNWVPYLGALAITAGASIAAFVQFDAIEPMLAVLGASFVIHILDGYVLLPWLTSRANRMSPVVVFVTVLVFGWLWGLPGLLLGVPVVVIVKAVCDRIDDLRPIGELLGD